MPVVTKRLGHHLIKYRLPLRRYGETKEIPGIAIMLATPAGAFVTGQTIIADGRAMVIY